MTMGRVGPTRSGWSDLEPAFRAVASRLSDGRDLRYDLPAFDVSGDVAALVVSRCTVLRTSPQSLEA